MGSHPAIAGMTVIYLAVTASIFARPVLRQMYFPTTPPDAADTMQSVVAARSNSGRCRAATRSADAHGIPDGQRT